MSKERELLKRWTDGLLLNDQIYRKLKKETEELLAEPEQEPIAWMYEREHKSFTELTLSVGFEKNFDGITIPLYAVPPTTSNPLSYEHLEALVDTHHGYPMTLGRAIEEAHGIGVSNSHYKEHHEELLEQKPLSTKQAEDLWETTFKSAVPYYIFDEICVAVEQYHGIGVDDE